MFQLWRKEDQDRFLIQILLGLVGVLLLFSGFLWWGWKSAPDKITVYSAPQPTDAQEYNINDIPNAYIYSFAQSQWQALHYWPSDRSDNQNHYAYENNIETLSALLTPAFKQHLIDEADNLKRLGRLNRTRQLTLLHSHIDIDDKVKKVAQNEWHVTLELRLTEYANKLKIKEVDIQYPLKIVRYPISPLDNPYGLAISGFYEKPGRIMM